MRKRLHFRAVSLTLVAVLGLAGTHIAVLALAPHPAVPSNCLQLLSALLALGLCFNRARLASDRFFRFTWLLFGTAFAMWSTGESLFLISLLRTGQPPPFPSLADILWMLFPLPILMATFTRKTESRHEWVNWIDSAQTCVFFIVLDILVFSQPPLLSFPVAYDVQSAALCMCWTLRYFTCSPGPERHFYRIVGAYLAAYTVLTVIGIHVHVAGISTGHWVDLCWDGPLLAFSTLVHLSGRLPAAKQPGREVRINLPKHLHGLSALGLAVLSISAGVVLQLHHTAAGIAVLAVSFLLFAIRTCARELQLHTAHDDLQHSVQHDALTGLGNRATLNRELTLRLGGDPAVVSRLTLFYIDVDRFKTINDGLGHQFGNDLLVAIARILRSTADEYDDLAVRLGGDKFVVLTNCESESEAQDRAQTYLDRLRKPLSLDGRVLHLTASTGIALAHPGMVPEEILRNSDCAMYVAKANGRNQAKLFESSMIQRATDELWLETDLREALHSRGVSVDYQPIYSLTGRAIVGFEALARWRHPTRGMISPALFIPVAEETGLVLELGKQVLREACRQMEEWNRLFDRNFYVSVNVSARQFAGTSLLPDVRSILEETGFRADHLKLEITESVLISGVQTVEGVLTAARRLGIEISLDDFGTGYSSLSYLLRFPFDVVKIDRSFVQALDRDPQRANLAEMIVQLAVRLGKKVVAEGVETPEEKNLLERMRCDLLQGYLFSKPLAPAVVEKLLRQHSGTSTWLPADAAEIWRPPTRPGMPNKPLTPQSETGTWDGHEAPAYLHG